MEVLLLMEHMKLSSHRFPMKTFVCPTGMSTWNVSVTSWSTGMTSWNALGTLVRPIRTPSSSAGTLV